MIYSYFFIFIIAIVLWNKLKTNHTLRHWRKSLDKSKLLFEQLYNDVDGYALSKEARRTHDSIEFVYGEIEFEPFIALLSLCHPNQKTIFYDLGSGIGKATIAAALVYDIKSFGIELFSPLHQCAITRQHKLVQLTNNDELNSQIQFIQGNLFEHTYPDATLIFINATAFFGESWIQLSIHLEHLTPGTHVVTTSKVLKSSQFEFIRETDIEMSWGVVKAYIQQRI